MKSGPIFVVGMNGSGTTMLLDCLDNHPNLYGYRRETRIIPRYISSYKKYGDLYQDENFLRFFNDVRNEIIFKIHNNNNPIPVPEEWRSLPRCLSTVFDQIFLYFAHQKGKKRWCEKSPMNVMHIKNISSYFPNAKFIHIIRDGRDCAASLYRRYGLKPEVMIYKWKKAVQTGRMQGMQINDDRYFEVFYEKLTEDPEGNFKNICKFINEPYEKDILKASRYRKNISSTLTTEIVKNKNRWNQYFTSDQIIRLEAISGKSLDEFGYHSLMPENDDDPSTLYLRFWTYYLYSKDRIRALLARRKNIKRDMKIIVHKYKCRFKV